MSPQVWHSLKQAGIMIVLAILGIVGSDAVGIVHILQQAGVNPLYFGIVTAIIAGAVRWAEGYRDKLRAEEGKVVEADVAFNYVKERASQTPYYELPIVEKDPGTGQIKAIRVS